MPNYVYVSGSTFYLIDALPEDNDFVHASYAARHMKAFGEAGGAPCAAGASYAATEVSGLFKRV